MLRNFLQKKQIGEVCDPQAYQGKPQELLEHPMSKIINGLIGTDETDTELLEAYNNIIPFFDEEDEKKYLIMGALKGSFFGQKHAKQLIKLLVKVLIPGQTIDPDKFWATINTFNESCTKGPEHLESFLHYLKEFIAKLNKQLIFSDLFEAVRAYYRVDEIYHSKMTSMMLAYNDPVQMRLILLNDATFSLGEVFRDLSEGVVKNLPEFERAFESLKSESEKQSIPLIEVAPLKVGKSPNLFLTF